MMVINIKKFIKTILRIYINIYEQLYDRDALYTFADYYIREFFFHLYIFWDEIKY